MEHEQRFTTDLINRIKDFFEGEYDVTISDETAERYLNALADAFASMGELVRSAERLNAISD